MEKHGSNGISTQNPEDRVTVQVTSSQAFARKHRLAGFLSLCVALLCLTLGPLLGYCWRYVLVSVDCIVDWLNIGRSLRG